MPPSGRRQMRGERLFLEPVSRKAMPVQFCCCVLVETACRSHAHHPEASVDRTVGSAHYPVALMAVTLAVARARGALHQPAVMPADCLAVQASERLASDIQDAPADGRILRQAAHPLLQHPARMNAVIVVSVPGKGGQQLVRDRNPGMPAQQPDGDGTCGQKPHSASHRCQR